jgi:hypothetical protein
VLYSHACFAKGTLTPRRTLSMTFGRPAAIPDSYIKLELPVEIDTVVDPKMPANSQKHASVQFFNGTMHVSIPLHYGTTLTKEQHVV